MAQRQWKWICWCKRYSEVELVNLKSIYNRNIVDIVYWKFAK